MEILDTARTHSDWNILVFAKTVARPPTQTHCCANLAIAPLSFKSSTWDWVTDRNESFGLSYVG